MTHYLITILLCLGLAAGCSAGSPTVLWDMKTLRQPPKFDVIDTKGNLRSIYYQGEPYQGKPTRVFAYLATPESPSGKEPAIVLVHGGLGRAFADWAEMWASRGYVALAMDVFGQGPDGKHTDDGGPNLDSPDMIFPREANESWSYAAVAKIVRGVSLLANLPEVDPKRIGITGISWGGYLTCIVAGVDDRLKAAAPIYGCGYLHEASAWSEQIQNLPEERRRVWADSLDPSCYLPNAKAPMLFMVGTNDYFFWLDSYQKTYRLARNRTVCVGVEMRHSQEDGASPVEIGIFMDQHLRGGKALPELGHAKRRGNLVEARFKSPTTLRKAELCFTTDSGAWKPRKWQTRDAKIDGRTITAELPAQRPLTYFLSVTDDRGASVTTEHESLEK